MMSNTLDKQALELSPAEVRYNPQEDLLDHSHITITQEGQDTSSSKRFTMGKLLIVVVTVTLVGMLLYVFWPKESRITVDKGHGMTFDKESGLTADKEGHGMTFDKESGLTADKEGAVTVNKGSQVNVEGNNILIGVSSVSNGFERRKLIREYQFDPYRNYSVDWRFFISRPDKKYEEQIRQENSTYGDIILLEDIADTRENAREVKPFYFFRYVEKHLKPYKYVAKMDDDAFVNIQLMTKDFISPNGTGVKEFYGPLVHFGQCWVPMGWFYGLSSDMMSVLNHEFATKRRTHVEEDFQAGFFLCESGVPYKSISFTLNRCHDLSLKKGSGNDYYHDLTANTVCVHQLKTEKHYKMVAQCASNNGFSQACIDARYEKGWTEL